MEPQDRSQQQDNQSRDTAILCTGAASLAADNSSSSISSSITLWAASQQASPAKIVSCQAAFLRQSAAVVQPILLVVAQLQTLTAFFSKTPTVNPLICMPPLSREQWELQPDSADGEPDAIDSHHAQVPLLATAPSSLEPGDSLTGKNYLQSILLHSAAVDLATQCVDTTLLLLDSSAWQDERESVLNAKLPRYSAQVTAYASDTTTTQQQERSDNIRHSAIDTSQKLHALLATLNHYVVMLAFF